MENGPDAEFKVTLNGLVDLNGLSIQDLENHLRHEMVNAIGNGLITGHTRAEVDEYQLEVKVSEFGPKKSRNPEMLSRSEFIEIYAPLRDSGGNFLFAETLEGADALADENDLGEDSIWTIVQGDTDMYAQAGLRRANKEYIVTTRPWKTGNEEAVWFESPAS